MVQNPDLARLSEPVNIEGVRRSDVAYVLAKLRIRGDTYLLLQAHRKWGDWSLVGGHIEATDPDWKAAAAREVQEEMWPLKHGDDVEVLSVDLPTSEWGPVPSASAGGRQWYGEPQTS